MKQLNRKGKITMSVVIFTNDNWLFQTKNPGYFNYFKLVKVTKKRWLSQMHLTTILIGYFN